MSQDSAALLERIRQDDRAELDKLKTVLLPQRVGMAVGARMLADEVSWYMLGRIEQLRTQELGKQRLEGHDGPAAVEQALALVRDEMSLVLHRIRTLGGEWMNAAMRTEGMLLAIEARLVRLDTLTTPGKEE